MKVIITGAAGYVGSALARLLIQRNYDVTLVDNYYAPSNIKDVNNLSIQNIDITKSIDLSSYDTLIHLAAVVGIKPCEEDKKQAFATNVQGTFNLLKTFKGRIVFASSSAVYGQMEIPEITEEHPVNPRSVYGKTKLEAEQIVKLHDNYCILRFSNIYGKGLLYKRTVSDMFIENALSNKPLQIHGDGKQRRDFIHINDVIKSYWYAMHSDISNTFNVGGNEALNINDIAELVCKNYRQLFGRTPEIKHLPLDCGVLWKDFTYSSKFAKTVFNYEPAYSVSYEIRNRLNAYKGSNASSRTMCN
jgi:UDP-glucose 4-epimerase